MSETKDSRESFEDPKMSPYVVTFFNPGTKLRVLRRFGTREEAKRRVEHYRRKYGAFPGYRRARIVKEMRV